MNTSHTPSAFEPPADQPAGTPGVSGREPTLATPAPQADGLSGREATLATPPVSVSGREATLATPAQGLSGREATLETPAGGEQPRAVGGATPMTPAAAAGTGRRERLGATTGFDEEWQLLAGRKGGFTGQTWGDFAMGGLLGEGGMGAVYRAWQRSLKRRVALKVLPSNLSANPRLLSRFQLEASAASKLQSPHVVQVYAIGEHQGHHYYAMEYVEGKDLHDLLRERRDAGKPITPGEAADYILQAARGLIEAGAKGIVHRDIKPPNLLVTGDGVLKIADFGIAKVLGEHHVTMTGQAVGTPAYVSPEQGRGDRTMDARSDLYSLGVVFYELACGARPFEGNTPNALIYQHCFEEPKLPRELNPAIPPELQAVILRCLQKKPEGRYQTAAELVRDLDGIRTGQVLKSAIAQYQLTTGAKEAKREQMNWLQRHLLPVAAASLLVIAGGVGASWWVIERNQQATLARERASLVGEKAVADQRAALGAALDAVAPIAEDIDDQLAAFAQRAPAGDQDGDLLRWRAKVASVRALETQLAPLVTTTPDAKARRAGRVDLDALIAKVGPGVPVAERTRARLDALSAEEARLRLACAQIDSTALRLSDRQRFGEQLTALTALTGPDDAQVVQWGARLTLFDQELAALRTRIAPLDQAEQVTVAERTRFQPVLSDLRTRLDDNDPDLLRWRDKLEGADRRVARLREDITAIVGVQPERIAKPKQAQIADKLADYQALVGADDPQVKDLLNAIAAADRAIAGARQRLAERAKDSGDGVIPLPAHAAFERDVQLLATLAAEGDTERLAYELQLAESRRVLEALRGECAVLEPTSPAPLALATQQQLAPKVERLVAKGALESERADRYRARLAAEAARVAALRETLRAYDQALPLTPALDEGLDQYARDVAKDDADLLRWQAKRERVRGLQDRLSVLDRQGGVPEQVEELFAELATLVGEDDPQLRGWRDRIARITQARATLRVLDQRASYLEPDIRQRLTELTALVGGDDRRLRAWQAKVEETTRLKAELARLDDLPALGQAAHAQAHAHLRRLVGALVGAEDAQARQAARRLCELDGPAKPAWAGAMGRDDHGLWADATLPGASVRFRFIASGRFTMGSPDQEAGRRADELPVPVTLPRAFWIADSETPRAVYRAVMGSDPSWTPLFDAATQPAERMAWGEAQACCAALGKAVAGFAARLPLEAEWEYACRAGSVAPWDVPPGMALSLDTIGKLAWHRGNSGEGAQASRSRLPNRLGLYDLHGNLSEWCADGYAPYPTIASVITAPATGTERRVLRGGSWGDTWLKTRAANRISAAPDVRSAYVGMRLVADVDWQGREPDGVALLARLAAAPAAEEAPRLHQVVAGETLASIASARLGGQGEADAKAVEMSQLVLLAANPWLQDLTPVPGTWLTLPPPAWTAHQVREGEDFAIIAKTVLGDAAAASRLRSANPWIRADRAPAVGSVVLIPAPAPPSVTLPSADERK